MQLGMALLWLAGCTKDADMVAQMTLFGLAASEPEGVIAETHFYRWNGDWEGVVLPEVEECTVFEVVTPSEGELPAPVSPGDVTITVDGEPVEPDDLGQRMLPTWPGGATLGISNVGGQFPDFDVPDLVVLSDIPSGTGTIEEDGGYTVTWDAGASDMLSLSVSWEDVTLHCTVEDDGAFTVPAAELLGPAEEILGALHRVQYPDVVDGRVRVFGMVFLSDSVD